ncbi:putative quinol monooxygenase [Microbacterium sp. HA-8]|uniref:putative quinol monooxygenase n=1 Tax=Microbacterium sp. HA-8 TaxID=3234200 RepID=UPI0038F70685
MNDPVVVTATFHPLAGHREVVLEALRVAIPRVHEERGCEIYAITAAPGGDIFMIEKWTSVADLDAHAEGAPVVDLNRALEGHLREPVEVVRYAPLPLGQAAKGQL